jgi:uncharacterized protein
MEVAGHPPVTLLVTSTAVEGTFFVYLEDVDAHGEVAYMSASLPGRRL